YYDDLFKHSGNTLHLTLDNNATLKLKRNSLKFYYSEFSEFSIRRIFQRLVENTQSADGRREGFSVISLAVPCQLLVVVGQCAWPACFDKLKLIICTHTHIGKYPTDL